MANSLTHRTFLRTLSYREFLSAFALSLFLVAIFYLIDFLSNGENNLGLSTFLSAVFCAIINHVWYKIEHRRSNDFIGRIIHTCIFIWTLFITVRVNDFFWRESYKVSDFDLGRIIINISLSVIIITLFEILVGIFNEFLIRLKWRIL
jgi:hypothetical protein